MTGTTKIRLNAGGAYRSVNGKLVLKPLDVPVADLPEGEPGPAGPSAYQVWLATGHTGTPADYLAFLKGDAGARGWTPMIRGAADGIRSLVEIYDWSGGAAPKPATGYLTSTGTLATAKADGLNFNLAKRVTVMQAITNASGIATFDFTSLAFANAPVVTPFAVGILTGSPAQVATVGGTLTKAGVQVKAQQAALVTGVLGLLVGFTVTLLVIEA